MNTLEACNQNLPYYLVRGEKVRMPLSSEVQPVTPSQVEAQIDYLTKVYRLFRLLWQENCTNSLLNGLPIDIDKAPELLVETGTIPAPINVVVRADTVGGKIVDINNKPAGLGLTLSAYQLWLYQETFGDTTPLLPNIDVITDDNFGQVTILSQRDYPFISDQKRLAEIMTMRTGQNWRVQYPELTPPQFLDAKTILSFSYLSGNDPTIRMWRQYLSQNPTAFLENPATAIYWDNKALMALPFMNLDLSNTLRMTIEDLREVFPPTYILRQDQDKLLIASSFSTKGVDFEEVNRDNVPVLGQTYLKPLGQSGGRNIAVKNLNDWGGAMEGLLKYARSYSDGFVAQQGVQPEIIGGMRVKDGYFVNTSADEAEFIALERMGTTENTPKIHGGSKTKLIPVCISERV